MLKENVCRKRASDKHEIHPEEEAIARDMKGKKAQAILHLRGLGGSD